MPSSSLTPVREAGAVRPSAGRGLLLIVTAGLLLRAAIAPFGGFRGDQRDMGEWTWRLLTAPLSRFYAAHGLVLDHLPGDLWVFWLLGHLYHLFAPGERLQGASFHLTLKVVPIAADGCIIVFLFLAASTVAGNRTGLIAAALYAFNPAILFVTSVWGQWDSLSAAVALGALVLVLRGRWPWAFPLLVYAALIKPPLAVLVPVLALHVWCTMRDGALRPVPALASALGCVAVFFAVLLPFSVGVPPLPVRWTIVQRLEYALNYRPYTTAGAFNLWATPLGGLQPDRHKFLFEVRYATWGTALFVLALAIVLFLYRRRPGERSLIWACTAAMLAEFVLTTRGHERYLLPAIVFGTALAAVTPRFRAIYGLLSLSFLANVYYIYALFYPAPRIGFAMATAFVYLVASLNVVLLAATVAVQRWVSEIPTDRRSPPPP